MKISRGLGGSTVGNTHGNSSAVFEKKTLKGEYCIGKNYLKYFSSIVFKLNCLVRITCQKD